MTKIAPPPYNSSNVVFFGSPPFAVSSLAALLKSGRKVSLVVTQPDRKAGRGRKLKPPAVKEFAEKHGLPVLQPQKMKDPAFLDRLRGTQASLFVVAAYGRMLPESLLSIPAETLNVHASLLPRWRGASPVHRAIVAGDKVTGVSIMKIVQEMDAGDVLYQMETEIGGFETAGELDMRLGDLGAEALLAGLDLLDQGKGRFWAQNPEEVTFAPLLKKEEGKVDWNRSAAEVHDHVRGFHPWPGAFTRMGEERIKLHATRPTDEPVGTQSPGTLRADGGRLWAASRDVWLEILSLQREGKKTQTAAMFLAGCRGSIPTRWE